MRNLFSQRNISLLFFATCLLIVVVRFALMHADAINFIGEENNIGASVAQCHGYSSPFKYPTGPTAWTLPLPVLLNAATTWIAGQTMIGYFIQAVIRFLMLSLACYFFLKILNPDNKITGNILFIAILSFYIYLDFPSYFYYNDDSWIATVLMAFLAITIYNLYEKNGTDNFTGILLLAIFIPLGQPSLIIPLILLIGFSFSHWLLGFKNKGLFFIKNDQLKLKHFIVWGMAFTISIGSWTYRNYETFHTFVPSKSNLWFEFYMSNVIDKDGVASSSSWRIAHPYENQKLCEEIKQQGEIRWLSHYKIAGHEYVDQNTSAYHHKVINRAKNALVYTDMRYDFIENEYLKTLVPSDKQKLANQQMIMFSNWLCLGYGQDEFDTKINALSLSQPQLIKEVWLKDKVKYEKSKYGIRNLVSGLAKGIIPVFFMIFLIISGHQRKITVITGVIYLLFLTPYILVSHETRYQLPLIMFQAAMVYLMTDWLIIQILKTKKI